MRESKTKWVVISLLMSAALLFGAVVLAVVLVKTKPKAEKMMPPKRAELVDVQVAKRTDETVVLQLTGTVTPAETVKLRARVSGEVVSISDDFIDGGLVKGGEALLTIDPADYELAVVQAQSALEKARFDYQLELGRQDVARREWALLKPEGTVSELEEELALRRPHLRASKAAVEAAEAHLQRATLDMERTVIQAPFDAVVLSRNAIPGSQAAQQDVLAELAGTDLYWVVATIPVDRIRWLEVPGSRAVISLDGEAVREGRVLKLLGDLEDRGRMARVLIAVEDPLAQSPEHEGKQALLIGSFVRVDIDGRELKQIFKIPRFAVRENSRVWVVTADETLSIREVEVVWRGVDFVLIRDGLLEGDRVVVSDLSTPIEGMNLNTGKAGQPQKEGAAVSE
jgi:RND family efflux transporter MFP subunit